MKTRSSRGESASKSQGTLSKKLWKSSHQNGHEGRQPLRHRNLQAVISDHQSPMSSKKHQSLAKSQLENFKENIISLHDGLSPIIGNRRRVLGLRNACRDPGSASQGSRKGKIAPPKVYGNVQNDKVSPLQENVDINTSKKDKGMNEHKQTAMKKRSIVPDKENVLAVCMTQTPLRQSKRIRLADRNKNTQKAPKKAQKDLFSKEQTNIKLLPEANNLSEERTLKGAVEKGLNSQARSQETTIIKDLTNGMATVQGNVTRLGSKENIDISCDKGYVAVEQEAGAGKKRVGHKTRTQKASLKNLKSQAAAVQSYGITRLSRSGSKENDNITSDKAFTTTEQEAETGKKELGTRVRSQRATSTKIPKNRTTAVHGSDIRRSGNKGNLLNACDKIPTVVEQKAHSYEHKASPGTVTDTNILPRRTSRASQKSLRKEDSNDNANVTPKRNDSLTKIKTNTATPAQAKLKLDKLPSSLKSERKAQMRSKQPVWASVRGIKITPGKRKSLRICSDTYEFTSSPSKENKEVKKRRMRKPKKWVKKKKTCTKLTLLTTDPSWQGAASKGMPLLSASVASSTNKAIASRGYLENSGSDIGEVTSIPSNMSSIRDDDAADEDFSCEANFDGFENSDEFQGFEGETRSSFVISTKDNDRLVPLSSTNMLPTRVASNFKSKLTGNSTPQMRNAQKEGLESASIPMISANVLPTPVISKHITKFIGGSSTPRVENTAESAPNQEIETADDSIAQCFGFNDESEEESELNISPVQQSRQQSRLRHTLEITGTSDVIDGELHPASLPSRFSWGSLRPGNQSRASATSRSSSMVAQGRSTSFMTNTSSQTSQPTISSFLVPTVEKQHLRPQRKKRDQSNKEKGSVSVETESGNKPKETDVSVLFDENELLEKEPSVGKDVGAASQPGDTLPSLKPSAEDATKSPEKCLQKMPRKSYDRKSLLIAKRKFIEMHAGYAESDSDTEVEEPDMKFKPKTNKKGQKASKKSKKSAKEAGQKASKKSKKSAKEAGQSSKKVSTTTSKMKKAADVDDSSLNEWASRLNSHFSEVEDSILVVE